MRVSLYVTSLLGSIRGGAPVDFAYKNIRVLDKVFKNLWKIMLFEDPYQV